MKTLLLSLCAAFALFTHDSFANPVEPTWWSCSCEDIDTGEIHYLTGNLFTTTCNNLGSWWGYQCEGSHIFCSYSGGAWFDTNVRVGRGNCNYVLE